MTNGEGREWLRSNTGMELPDDAKIEADKEEQKQMQQDGIDKDGEVDKLGKKMERLIIEHNMAKEHERLKERMEQKFELINKATKEKDEDLANTRIRALEKIIEKVEALG